MVARHVSAANLKQLDAPTLLTMNNLDHEDKKIWKARYDKEYCGLKNIPAWTIISEQEYLHIPHIVGQALPTMSLFTVKYFGNRKPKSAKWQIFTLRNLDTHKWLEYNCFAPVYNNGQTLFPRIPCRQTPKATP